MNVRWSHCLLLISVMGFIPLQSPVEQTSSTDVPEGLHRYPESQVYFEENKGQYAPEVRFQAPLLLRQVRLMDSGASIALIREVPPPQTTPRQERFRNISWMNEPDPAFEALVWNLYFVGGNTHVIPEGREPVPGYIHYLTGNDPAHWATHISRFREVWYPNLWPGIDLRYYGAAAQSVKYDLIVSPGADPSQVQFMLAGILRLEPAPDGSLHIHTAYGTVTEAQPYVYQLINGIEQPVAADYIQYDSLSFGISISGRYDKTQPLIIDPLTFTWASFFHSSLSDDYVMAVARDKDEYVYIAGYTQSLTFPVTPGVYQPAYGGNIDAFVSKLMPGGSTPVFVTYIGGTDWELAYGLGLNAWDEPYVAGFCRSADFPATQGSLQPVSGGGLSEGFLARLTADGAGLVYATYLGGNNRDYIYDLWVASSGEAYMTGNTLSPDFPLTAGAYNTVAGGNGDVFVSKIAADGSSLLYSTLYGGNSFDIGNAITVDAAGVAHIGGSSGSANLPVTTGAWQSTAGFTPMLTQEDAFYARFSATGNTLLYATYLGGSDSDGCYGICLDAAGSAYLTGTTYSTNFPVSALAIQTGASAAGGGDAFVTKFDPAGSMVYSTCLGGTQADYAKSVRVNAAGEAVILGATSSVNFPVTSGSASYAAMYDGFVTVLEANGYALKYSQLYGGTYNDYPRTNGALFLRDNRITAGVTTHSPNIPVTSGSYQTTKTNGTADAPWIVGLEMSTVLAAQPMAFGLVSEAQTRQIKLSWQVSPDAPGVSVVERRSLDEPWTAIARMPGSAGTHTYTWRDDLQQQSVQPRWYRIVWYDASGEVSYSEILEAHPMPSTQEGLSIYPNPATGPVTLAGISERAQELSLEIHGISGSRLLAQKVSIPAGGWTYQLDTQAWDAGIYLVRAQYTDGSTFVQKLTVP